jgi:hypothetical protein
MVKDVWLGRRQRWVLQKLSGGRWYRYCGWDFAGPDETAKICESLVRHGFASEVGQRPVRGDRQYQITQEGREWLARNPRGR